MFTERDSNSEGSEAKPKPNAPVERLPSRNERSEAIKIPIPQPQERNPNTIRKIGDVFGFFISIEEIL
ncbi:MAG: hypothetical protein IK085_01370 [Clostridia bacterium]|nr:hypothetical protein [Clostridia bacterium]